MINKTSFMLILLIALIPTSMAQSVQIDIEGTFSSGDNWGIAGAATQFQPGDSVTGRFVYDTTAFEEDYSYDENHEDFPDEYSKDWAWYLRSGLSDFTVQIYRGSILIETLNMSNRPYTYLTNITGAEYLNEGEPEPTTSYSEKKFIIECLDQEQWQWTEPHWVNSIYFRYYGALENIYTDPVRPDEIFDPSVYDYFTELSIGANYYNAPFSSTGGIHYAFSIDQIDVTLIPEPATLFFLAIGACLVRRKRSLR